MPFDYIMTARTLSKERGFTDEPGPLRFVKVPRDATHYDARHIVGSPGQWATEVRDIADGNENPNSISPAGDVLIFVHGYNNAISHVLERMRMLRKNLLAEGWRGEVVAFDWPSANQTLNYWEDRHDGASVASELVTKAIRLLSEGQKRNCPTNVHIIAHSAGSYVTMEAFVQAEKKGELFKADWRIGQVVFIAGDVSAASLSEKSEWSGPFFKRIMRFTNYYSPYDAALAVSNAKRLGISPRAGRNGLPKDAPHKAVDVNCGPYFNALKPPAGWDERSWTHSWYISDRIFARDLAMTLEGGIDRTAIPTREKTAEGFVLADHPRPAYQSHWQIKETARFEESRTV